MTGIGKMLEEPGGSFFSSGGMTMRQVKEEVCLYYMGFGICARGLHVDKKQGGNGKEGIEVTDENGKRNVQ